ncbi:MAG: hypothetical protein KA319_04880 [Ferruginibacter sp.]|nr:hypothetical protein [Ferruginibacter sp.]
MSKNITLTAVYFILSTLITWWFIVAGKTLYFSTEKMIISCCIAGAKWSIQIIAALFILKEKKWEFIKRIGFTCFIGSCILLPYCFFENIRSIDKSFLLSLVAAVLVMIVLYYKAVIKTKLSTKWFWGWIVCLATAISLQLFVVFKIV